MITDKIKAMFQFIEFLHSNIGNFKQYAEVINELYLLDKERHILNPEKNFADKLKKDNIQAEIEHKFKVIQENIITPIRNKATELNIYDFENEPLSKWNGVESDIYHLKKNFTKVDLPEIFKHKSKYIEFREQTNCTYFQDFFFYGMDETLKQLFDYFKETNFNEFGTFETKSIPVNDIGEAVKLFQLGHKKFTLPIDFLSNPSKVQQPKIETLPPPPNSEQKEKLSDIITHQNSVQIVEGIKIQYKNIKGKRLKLLLMALQDLGLFPKERTANLFHDACLKEFNWNIASYNAMNGYVFNDRIDNAEYNSMKQYLETLTKTK